MLSDIKKTKDTTELESINKIMNKNPGFGCLSNIGKALGDKFEELPEWFTAES